MTIVDLRKDVERNAMTIVAEYPATADRVWELWADPRQLERWWGPPTYPATVTDHELAPGGTVRYFMTAPDGERYHGGWHVVRVEPPRRLELVDFFASADGAENTEMPRSTTAVSIADAGDGTTRMTIESRWDSAEDMARVLEMGMEEGIREAIGQIDALLAERPS
jgi:uncharacterized protein YndB with AHSA1/START domain